MPLGTRRWFFLSHFKDLKDPRQQGKISYLLDEILLLCLLAGAETIVDIAVFGRRSWRCCAGSAACGTESGREECSARLTPLGSEVASLIPDQRIRGSSAKVWNGGGEDTVHSSVVAPSPQ